MSKAMETDVQYLPGVGPKRAALLRSELEIATVGDLLHLYPFRYIDRSTVQKIADVRPDQAYVQILGTVLKVRLFAKNGAEITAEQVKYNLANRLSVIIGDDTGEMEVVFFKGVKWMHGRLIPGKTFLFFGKPQTFNGRINMVHPEFDVPESAQAGVLTGIYPSTEKLKTGGITGKVMVRLMSAALELVLPTLEDPLPDYVLKEKGLVPLSYALRQIHFPADQNALAKATYRLKFEELFLLQLSLLKQKYVRSRSAVGLPMPRVGEAFNRCYQALPYDLTGAQKRVIKEIREDLRSGHQMNRLLQGDVGSGKTLVALLSMLIAVDNGCQACMMAPTEILANQHYLNISKMLDGIGVHVELLTGSVKTSEKKKIKQRLAEGEIDILIGTHALIEKDVIFKNLGFAVIDEQHRFGVEQRSKLWTKNSLPPHVLVMTATPIPRTLAMSVYGDLDCSTIDELPPGRKSVKTIHCTDQQRLKVFGFIRNEISKGRQVYIVYPLIEESESLDLKDLMDGYESVSREFPLPDYQISIVHGRMDAESKDYEMERFKRGETHIMVSTTVIEVGVDVPNATVMVIENAERFGLSQLHQLRGRVGRGGEQSYCILMTKNNLQGSARERINTMVNTTDGFRIAETDLKLRGPGDLQGLRQSGVLALKLADIVDDEPIVRAARESVEEILDEDPELKSLENVTLKQHIQQNKRGLAWGKIS